MKVPLDRDYAPSWTNACCVGRGRVFKRCAERKAASARRYPGAARPSGGGLADVAAVAALSVTPRCRRTAALADRSSRGIVHGDVRERVGACARQVQRGASPNGPAVFTDSACASEAVTRCAHDFRELARPRGLMARRCR